MSARVAALHMVKLPQLALGRFFAVRVARMGAVWGAVFGITVTSSSLAYKAAYATELARHQLAVTFGSNIGLQVLLGNARHLETVAGFTAWRTMGVATIVGAIWAILAATKTFRGEESAGRLELFLAGRTTARRAAANLLGSVGVGILAMYIVVGLVITVIGRQPGVGFSLQNGLFFAVALVASATELAVVGAFMSQLMPTRSRAATASAVVFGVFFGLRAVADAAASAHWLIYVSPLGWVEQLHPLTGSQPLWLVPIGLFVLILSMLSVYLAGKRDLGASFFADKDSAMPRTRLLSSPFGVAVRLSRAAAGGWLAALLLASVVFCSLAKTAGQVFSSSPAIGHVVGRISQQAQIVGATTFLGLIFFLIMTLIMLLTTSVLGKVREEESQGYLDNMLTQPITRWRWLGGRLALVMGTIIAACLFAGLGGWLGTAAQHSGIAGGKFFLAAINSMAPSFCLLGIGMLAFGFVPRITTAAMYVVIVWSFLVEILSSIGNINHWLLDTSILHHVALVPAVDPKWNIIMLYVAIGILGSIVGAWRFNHRDLMSE